jgi:hypothetical protein
MRKLYYSSGSMLVADVTCKAVLRYARALADVGKSDVVSVPVVTDGGSNAYDYLLYPGALPQGRGPRPRRQVVSVGVTP